MKLTPKLIHTKNEREIFTRLLREAGLPTVDVDGMAQILIGYHEGTAMVGTGGLEFYGNCALIRSVSLQPAYRGHGLGKFIINDLLTIARGKGKKTAYLLTETASGFFKSLGFEQTSRIDIPDEVKRSTEFRDVCPDSAVAMRMKISAAESSLAGKASMFFL